MKNKIFFIGDFKSNVGPSVVNRNIRHVLKNKACYSLMENKILRILEMIYKIIISKYICICSFSKIDKICIIFSKIFKKRIVYLMHGYLNIEKLQNNAINNNDLRLEEYIITKVDMVICVSKLLMNEVKKDYKNIKIDYVFNGIDWEEILNLNTNINNKNINENKNKNIIISTGGGMPQKNNLIICEAINNLNKTKFEKNKIKYILIGKDFGNYDEIKKYSFVEYYKELSHEECLNKMGESSLYIQNSYFETFCLSPLEALGCGCSILLSKNIGCIDLFNNLNQTDIILNNQNIHELEEKIEFNLLNPNYDRITMDFDFNTSSVDKRVEELIKKIEE